jgi:phosphotransferase system  glucose/maltose/N-acetylglucosamine-specific IIC component
MVSKITRIFQKTIQKKSFISITNGNPFIVFICGYCMLGLNFQLLLVFPIIGSTYMLLTQYVLILGTLNHYKEGVQT